MMRWSLSRALVMMMLFSQQLLGPVQAKLQLAQTFGSHMVLQRVPQEAAIYGFADRGADIRISLMNDEGDVQVQKHSVADEEGDWMALLPPQSAGGPYTVIVTNLDSMERVILHDVLFGDVWLCSGQSNMQMTVSLCLEVEKEAKKIVDYPHLRLFTVALNTSTEVLKDIAAPLLPWSVSNEESVLGPDWNHFSATCYFFGQKLYERLQIPIGLVASSYGGTPIRAWTDQLTLSECPMMMLADEEEGNEQQGLSLPEQLLSGSEEEEEKGKEKVPQQMVDGNEEDGKGGEGAGDQQGLVIEEDVEEAEQRLSEEGGGGNVYMSSIRRREHHHRHLRERSEVEKKQEEEKKILVADGQPPPNQVHDGPSAQDSAVLFNAMIHPLLRMTVRGVVWYQGEADIDDPDYYECAFPAMIRAWRYLFTNSQSLGPLSFGYVQLSSYDTSQGIEGVEIGHMRISQYSAFKEPNIFLAPSFDLGIGGDIHPPDKQDVGLRLAFNALYKAYNLPEYVTALGPSFSEVEATQSKDQVLQIKITLTNVGLGIAVAPTLLREMFDITNPQARDSLEAIYPSEVELLATDALLLTFPPLPTQVASVLLRYGYRNNLCPARKVPYASKLDEETACGIYSQSTTGYFFPKVPTLKEVMVVSA